MSKALRLLNSILFLSGVLPFIPTDALVIKSKSSVQTLKQVLLNPLRK
jgi:hypothetical protein